MPESAKKTKVYLNGVEYIPNLNYTGWKPGFEYSKNLSFKNLEIISTNKDGIILGMIMLSPCSQR
jgi:hypothetical protein